jgi:hypothetical protein
MAHQEITSSLKQEREALTPGDQVCIFAGDSSETRHPQFDLRLLGGLGPRACLAVKAQVDQN